MLSLYFLSNRSYFHIYSLYIIIVKYNIQFSTIGGKNYDNTN